jgi:hypothetical protein
MSKYQRTKGANGEREVVNRLKEAGIPCKRISMMETGNIDKGDILVANVWKAQVKVGNQTPKFFYDAFTPEDKFLFSKRDRKDWLVTMPLSVFLELFA